MTTYLEIHLHEEPFLLLPQKALFRPLYRQLILGDVHLGKATHFRRQGIPMPAQSHLRDVDTLHYLLDTYKPETVVILGDLFHSSYNSEWVWFKALLMHYPDIQFVLVQGNHDILPEAAYEVPNLMKVAHLEELHLIFTHHPLERSRKFNICGHIHPGIRLNGMARQSAVFPCFYKTQRQLILPAFGNLTGVHLLDREEDAEYYLVNGNRVLRL